MPDVNARLTPETLPEILRGLRLAHNKYQNFMVHALDKTPKTIRKWEDTGRIKFHDLVQYLDVLGYEIVIRRKRSEH